MQFPGFCGLSNVAPGRSHDGISGRFFMDRKQDSKFSVFPPLAPQPPHFHNLCICKYGVVVFHTLPTMKAEHSIFVKLIHAVRHSFKIVEQVAIVIAVLVVYLKAVWHRSIECFVHQAMYGELSLCFVSIQTNAEIPCALQLSGAMHTIAPTIGPASNPTHRPMVTDFVDSFRSENWFPHLLAHDGIIA